jgi:hypothetical protein
MRYYWSSNSKGAITLKRARPQDCKELCRRRVELELLLFGESIDYERCVRICRSMVG